MKTATNINAWIVATLLSLFFISAFLPDTAVYAQTGLYPGTTTGNIFDKNRNKRDYDRYDLEKFFSEKELEEAELNSDTARLKQMLMATPEELRKLGASEELIQRLMELNSLQDSIGLVEMGKEREAMEEKYKGTMDSISLKDFKKLIEIEKRDLIDRALALPEAYIYGHQFFRNSNLKILFDTEQEIRPPDNYKLGVGDELNVAMWGKIDYNRVFVVEENGSINPELAGRIYVRGLTYTEVKELIKEKFAKVYDLKKSNMDVTITFSRIISVNFVGELLSPGTYRFPAATSVFNALVAIDGPNQLGSVREIFIKRNGKTVKTLDIYKYLNDPDSQQDFFLEENDYIVIPPMRKVVNISGQVRREFNYELKNNEGLADVIGFAGGLKAEAFTKNINIKRYRNNQEVLIDVNLDSLQRANQDFAVKNGDSIFVYRVPIGLRNYVQVTGAVKVPGKYEVRKGDKITDILYKTEGVLDEADLNRAYVIRLKENQSKLMMPFDLRDVLEDEQSPDNYLLENLDTIQVLSHKEYRQDFTVQISGAVRKEGEYEYAEGLTLKDILYFSGGLNKEAANNRIEVSRVIKFTDEETGKSAKDRIVVKRVEVNPDISIDQNAAEFELKPYDHVFVRLSPDFQEQQMVKIYGEIVYPGEYPLLSKEEKLTSLIDRAGGLNGFAFSKGSRLYRNEDSIGYVLLDVDKAYRKARKVKFNYILADGDSIFVPKLNNVVTLSGAVRHFEVDSVISQISVPFEGKRRRAKYYINRYGAGFSRYAKKKRTYVELPNGNIKQTRRFMFFKIYPKVENGSTVFVDITDRKRNEKIRLERKKNRNWNDAFDSFSSKVATVLTILVLVQQVRTQ